MGTRRSVRWTATAQLLVCCLLFSRTAWGQTVTLEAQPPSIAVSSWYSQVEARVILKNASGSAISKPSLSFFTNDGFEVEVGKGAAQSVPTGESVVWPVRVKNVDRARVPGAIQFEASYTSAASAARHRVFTTVNVTAVADAGQQKPIETTLEGTFESISENRPGLGYLLVTNNLDVPVKITAVKVKQPPSIRAVKNITPFTVAARSTTETEIKLEAESKITPGTYPVLLEVSVEWERDGHHQSRSVIVSKQAGVGIFFESELLKVLGVPSFLLLPGCLFLFTMQLLVTFGVLGVKNESRLPQLSVTSPGFWIIAVTFSGVFAWIYNTFGTTNYLERYGVDDLRNVWLWSIALGIVTYLIIGLATKKRRSDRVPTSQDGPITILRKMSKHGVGILSAPVQFRLNNVDFRGYPAERIEDDQIRLWVVPKVVTEWADSPEARAAQGTVEGQVNARANPSDLADTLETAARADLVSVSWSALGSVPNPYHLKMEAITAYLPPEVMVEIR